MATQEQKNASDLGEQAIALAEQLGRIAGTIEGTAESWLNRQQLADQLTRVRDGATQMLEGLTAGVAKGRKLVQAGRGKAKHCEACAGRCRAPGRRSRTRARQAAPEARSVNAWPEEVGFNNSESEIGGSEPSATEELRVIRSPAAFHSLAGEPVAASRGRRAW